MPRCYCALIAIVVFAVFMYLYDPESRSAHAAIPQSVKHPHATFERFFRPKDCDVMHYGRGSDLIRYDLSKSGQACEREYPHHALQGPTVCRSC